MKRHQNLWMLLAVAALVALPLWTIRRPAPAPDGRKVELFRGADDRAKDAIGALAPGYEPWFKPLMEPPSAEIGSLLFALQAALGAGVIGYHLGVSVTRSRMARAMSDPSR